jgi:hypothetical protein
MRVITRGRLIAAAVGLSASVATAQSPILYGPVAGCPLGNCAAANHGTYGPALFAVNPKGHAKLPGPDEPGCVGRSSYPLTDWHYIRQFCGPTFQPGTCYGYHATKWRKWEETCASVGGCGTAAPEVMPPGPLVVTPSAPPAAMPMPVPPSSEVLPLPKEDKLKGDVPKVDPVSPPKVPLVPAPTEPGKINTTDATVPTPMPQVVPPSPEPRVVVPPMPK